MGLHKAVRRKRKKTHLLPSEEDERAPKSFVFRIGNVTQSLAHLVVDFRLIMEPYTAASLQVLNQCESNIQETRKNRISDYLAVAGPLGMTHLISFSQTELGAYFRIIRLPQGPTLTFSIESFSLINDVRSCQKRPYSLGVELQSPPLVVLNNFGADKNHKLISVALQNMFPKINVATVKLNECRRVVLFNYENESDSIQIRHYVIKASPTGLTKSVKKIVKARIPNLARFDDIADFVLNAGDISDSEVEDTPENRIVLPQNYVGRGNVKSHARLQELGPRMKIQLIKMEEKVCDGTVIYHKYVNKTPDEIMALEKQKTMKTDLKHQRREEQEANVARKEAVKDAQRKDQLRALGKLPQSDNDDSDAGWYRQEVGEELDIDEELPKKKYKFQNKKKKSQQ